VHHDAVIQSYSALYFPYDGYETTSRPDANAHQIELGRANLPSNFSTVTRYRTITEAYEEQVKVKDAWTEQVKVSEGYWE
jgi:hypothetical protein